MRRLLLAVLFLGLVSVAQAEPVCIELTPEQQLFLADIQASQEEPQTMVEIVRQWVDERVVYERRRWVDAMIGRIKRAIGARPRGEIEQIVEGLETLP